MDKDKKKKLEAAGWTVGNADEFLQQPHTISTCAVAHMPPCPEGEWNGWPHRWSGWPGAYCMVCFTEDPEEICLATHCVCACHAKQEE